MLHGSRLYDKINSGPLTTKGWSSLLQMGFSRLGDHLYILSDSSIVFKCLARNLLSPYPWIISDRILPICLVLYISRCRLSDIFARHSIARRHSQLKLKHLNLLHLRLK